MHNILWLSSWYPNKYDGYCGDFIQRHAIAVAPYCNLTVMVIQLVPHNWQKPLVAKELLINNGFNEQIVYLKLSNLPSPFNKMVDQWNYMRVFKQMVAEYLTDNLPNLVHVHVPVKAGIIGLWLKKKLSIPMAVTEHWAIYNDFAIDKFNDRSLWFKNLVKRVIKRADVFMPVSKNLGDSINQLVVEKPFMVVNNVVNTALFYFNPTNNSPLFWFIHVSMLNYSKNPKGILKAFSEARKKNKSVRLKMIGVATKELITYSDELGIRESVVFTGVLPQEEVAMLLQESDAFVLFSFYENMPCVIAEALCCGLPIISSDVGGIAESIDANNGILIDSNDIDQLTLQMLAMVNNYNKYDRQKIAKAATERYNYSSIGKQITTIYEEILIK